MPTEIHNAFVFNIWLLVAVFILSWLFITDFFGAIWLTFLTFCLSLLCWGIFVASHFIGKYW